MAGKLSMVLPLAITQQQQWKIAFPVHYSHFFRFPPNNLVSSSSSSSTLKPIPEYSRLHNGGTWFAAASTATLEITSDVFDPLTNILTVSLQGKIIEEHYTSSLQFSLLQVSCVIECPTKGSRVVIASYRDSRGQIQKFALRFKTSSHAETFISSLKLGGVSNSTKSPRFSPAEVSEEPPLAKIKKSVPKKRKRKNLKRNQEEVSFKDAIDAGIPSNCFTSEISSESQFVTSNRSRCSGNTLSFLEPLATSSPRVASILNYSGQQKEYSQEPVLGYNTQSTSEVDMPRSFSTLLTNCSGEVEQEKVYVPVMEPEENFVPVTVMEPEEENDLKSQIMKYMSDPSFYDILAKVEEAITEMGGFLEQ